MTIKNCIDKDYIEMELSSNMEDYMETIIILSEENKVVRVKDIAKKLDIKMPSVTAALNKLKKIELIEYEKYGFIELTKLGRKIASQVLKRHQTLSRFFYNILDLPKDESENIACKIEHVISTNACAKLFKLTNFLEEETDKNSDLLERLKTYINKI